MATKRQHPEVEWRQGASGDWFSYLNGHVLKCVVCEAPLEHNARRECRHKCSARVEAGKLAAMTRLQELGSWERTATYHRRLQDGFEFMCAANEEELGW